MLNSFVIALGQGVNIKNLDFQRIAGYCVRGWVPSRPRRAKSSSRPMWLDTGHFAAALGSIERCARRSAVSQAAAMAASSSTGAVASATGGVALAIPQGNKKQIGITTFNIGAGQAQSHTSTAGFAHFSGKPGGTSPRSSR